MYPIILGYIIFLLSFPYKINYMATKKYQLVLKSEKDKTKEALIYLMFTWSTFLGGLTYIFRTSARRNNGSL